MSYQALYRRLRPQNFEDVIGQEHIIKTLKNQIATGRINHAYLFCGTRGTGKTSTAKILSRAVNCTGEGQKPCNACPSCLAISENRNMNVIEIDAASNNSVDNAREITEEVKYPPTEGKYKVYIIDEVHMLSVAAFNALLKTLEEPPEYIIFILATTDPQRIPKTILSRCQRFDFHRISHKEMTDVLGEYMEKEGKNIDKDALEYIAEISDGAMRDALSVLDQCLSFYNEGSITADDVRRVVGSVDRNILFDIIDGINGADCDKCLKIIDDVCTMGRDLLQFISDIIAHLRNLLLAVSLKSYDSVLDYSEEYVEKLIKQGRELGFNYVVSLIGKFTDLSNAVKYSSEPRLLLEVECIKACNPVSSFSFGEISKRIDNIEKKIAKGVSLLPQKTEETQEEENTPTAKPVEKALPEDIKEVTDKWKGFASTVKDNFLRPILEKYTAPGYLNDGFLTLVCKTNAYLYHIETKQEILKQALAKYFSKEFDIKVMTEPNYQQINIGIYGGEDPTVKGITQESFEAISEFAQFEG